MKTLEWICTACAADATGETCWNCGAGQQRALLAKVLDLGDGWSIYADPAASPYLRAPNGEAGEILPGDAPSPGWIEALTERLDDRRPLRKPGRLALSETLSRWGWRPQ